jgi:hypothetical protein
VINEDDDSGIPSDLSCGDCQVLMEALRDAEQQCREAEDAKSIFSIKISEHLLDDEREYFAKIAKLEQRRNCALEVLLKHQRQEHL